MSARLPDELLTTAQVAELLKIHPKQVYRLVKEGLPGKRVGGDWRFPRAEVLAWVNRGGSRPSDPAGYPHSASHADAPPPLLAANGDVAVELLLGLCNSGGGPLVGFVQADRGQALELLGRGAVLVAGSHGEGPPARIGDARLARIHLVRRAIGLAVAAGRRAPRLAELRRLRIAGRPPSAGVVAHFERALREEGIDPRTIAQRSTALASHGEVACALLRGEADVGLLTRAWAHRVGLAFRALAEESYGLLVRATDLGDARVVRLCEIAQSERYRAALAGIPGYDAAAAGDIRYDTGATRAA
jgi:putative molybdopterin biosynthesis protein